MVARWPGLQQQRRPPPVTQEEFLEILASRLRHQFREAQADPPIPAPAPPASTYAPAAPAPIGLRGEHTTHPGSARATQMMEITSCQVTCLSSQREFATTCGRGGLCADELSDEEVAAKAAKILKGIADAEVLERAVAGSEGQDSDATSSTQS